MPIRTRAAILAKPPAVLEKRIEYAFKRKLEGKGFKVLKFETPGTTGTPDRFILMPVWSPAPPEVAEFKQEGEKLRKLQEAVKADWSARGIKVHTVAGITQAMALADQLIKEAIERTI